MIVWLVTPAWRRYEVTRLALAQRAHLQGVLAGRGIDLRCVVVADDENLDIAREHGFDTLELDNRLGAKVNAGMVLAGSQRADWVCFAGSDDWLHPDLFDLPETSCPPIVSGYWCSIVDLSRGMLRRLHVSGREGVPPWLIPRWALEPCGFRPVADERTRGMELGIVLGLGVRPTWVFHESHDLCRVGFKTDLGITGYESLSRLVGYGPEQSAWDVLGQRYPAELVEMARMTVPEAVAA